MFFRFSPRTASTTGSQKEHYRVELFCGITPLCARPTRETFRGIYRGPGRRRGTRRPTGTVEELLQGIAGSCATASVASHAEAGAGGGLDRGRHRFSKERSALGWSHAAILWTSGE